MEMGNAMIEGGSGPISRQKKVKLNNMQIKVNDLINPTVIL
jgi:hypothetical protein